MGMPYNTLKKSAGKGKEALFFGRIPARLKLIP
jgi:hypothetical protein